MERGDHGLFQGTISVGSWRDSGELQKTSVSHYLFSGTKLYT